MTTKARIDALRALEKAVEAGNMARVSAHQIKTAFTAHYQLRFISAFNGDDDAVKKLHHLALPNWVIWDASQSSFGWEVGLTDGHRSVYSTDKHSKARAWLLAIIRALIAQEGGE